MMLNVLRLTKFLSASGVCGFACTACLTLMLFTAPVQFASAEDGETSEALVLSDAWIRAMPPTQKMTAAYLKVSNRGTRPVVITDVSSPLGRASLHETRVEGGRSSMRPAGNLQLSPGETLEFKPGALHIMLMGLKHAPVEGNSAQLCLRTDAGDFCTQARVQRSAGAQK